MNKDIPIFDDANGSLLGLFNVVCVLVSFYGLK